MESLPFITARLPGTGGRIKAEPAHFTVEELPLYGPSGSGEHLYLLIEREGWSTRPLVERLARLWALPETAVGVAGLKDRHARATQTFSLHLPGADPEEAARRVEAELPVRVLSARFHGNKLRTGHLAGNRFSIVVADALEGALPRAREIMEELLRLGVPNFYGPQRFGADGDNAAAGRELLFGRSRQTHWKRRLMLSAWQSELFNRWLAGRIADGLYASLLAGDVARKCDSGGLFTVDDPAAELPRFERFEISHTGPMFGKKMPPASGLPGEREQALLAGEGIDRMQLARAGLDGGRRAGRFLPSDLTVEPAPEGLRFGFALPKGSYATVVLREFTRSDGDAVEGE